MPIADEEVLVSQETKTHEKIPNLWSVKFHNDDYTPMDFVVYILVDIFKLSVDESMDVMLKIHNQGSSVVGLYQKDIADTKANKVMMLAATHNHPLTVETVIA